MGKRIWSTKSTRHAKITWLLEHKSMWEGWEELGDSRQREIVKTMIRDGLVSEKTYYRDVNLTSLIIKARKVRREKK